jgi:predicted AAA+ superfamily ATPase
VLDLLDYATYAELLARPDRLGQIVAGSSAATVVIDEVQRLPELLDEVHRLIEQRGTRFVLTGSGARKLQRSGVNLLAGRARTIAMHPLTAAELGDQFDLEPTRHRQAAGGRPAKFSFGFVYSNGQTQQRKGPFDVTVKSQRLP